MAKKSRKEQVEELYQKLEESYDRWNDLYTHGGSDPFWPDGVNLNLIRNHISHYKSQIQQIEGAEQREVLFRPLPEKVDKDYMADAEGIRHRARERLAVLKADPNLQYIRERVPRMKPKDVEKLSLNYAVSIPRIFEQAIQQDDLVVMRRMTNSPFDEKYYAEKVEAIHALQPEENEQLSLFYDSTFEEDDGQQGWSFGMGGM